MRPIIEYANRVGYFKEVLKPPFSLFLENVWDDFQYTVLVVSNYHGKDECLMIRHWDIVNIDKNRRMPPCKKSIISKEALFESEFVILDGYRTMEYFYEDYDFQREAVPDSGDDTQRWVEDEQEEYRFLVSKFYFSLEHQIQRESILWHHFMNGFMSKPYNMYLRSMPVDAQQCIIQEIAVDHWKNWLLWRKCILDFPVKVAPELAFCEIFENKLRGNVKYQESQIEEEKKWSQTYTGEYNSEYGDLIVGADMQ